MCNVFVRTDITMGEEDMIVRVYKDVYVDDKKEENHKEIAIDIATSDLGDFEVEIQEGADE